MWLQKFFGTIASAVALIALVGCTDPGLSPEPTPTETSTAAPASDTVSVYWAISNPTAIRIIEEVVPFYGDRTDSVAILSALVSGRIEPIDPEYVNLWSGGNKVNQVTVSDGIATVDLNIKSLNVGGEGEAMAIAQIVWTLTENDKTIKGVKFLVNGKPAESLAGHVDTTGVFKRDTLDSGGEGTSTLTSVSISNFADGQAVDSPVAFTGTACTFEANVAWQLFKDETSVQQSSTTAAEACPVRSEWTVDLGELEPGSYRFVVQDLSANDGSVISEDSKTFTVR